MKTDFMSYAGTGVDIDVTDAVKRDMAKNVNSGDERVLNRLGVFGSLGVLAHESHELHEFEKYERYLKGSQYQKEAHCSITTRTMLDMLYLVLRSIADYRIINHF